MGILPSIFVSHGAPDIVLQDIPATKLFRELGHFLPRPRAIVVASAHWTTADVAVDAAAQPKTIHDFGGFAQEMYAMRYPAPGDPTLAARIVEQLQTAGIAVQSHTRGFDHGAWVPLKLMYPNADIPVVSLSVQPRHDGRHHLAVGAALTGLRSEDVLIIGSGSATHNLGELMPGVTDAPEWVAEFDDWMVACATAGESEDLADWERHGPHARRNHPSPEHWLPLLVAMGAGGGAPGRVLHRSTTWGVLSMTALAFG